MEAAGLAIGVVGIAALFTTCIESFDIVVKAREFGEEFDLLCTQVSANKYLALFPNQGSIAHTNLTSSPSNGFDFCSGVKRLVSGSNHHNGTTPGLTVAISPQQSSRLSITSAHCCKRPISSPTDTPFQQGRRRQGMSKSNHPKVSPSFGIDSTRSKYGSEEASPAIRHGLLPDGLCMISESFGQ